MPLVAPLPVVHSPEVEIVARFFLETLGFPPNSVLTVPAAQRSQRPLRTSTAP